MQVAPSVWGWRGSGQPYWAELRGPWVLVVQRQGPHSCRPMLQHGSPASWLSSLPYKQRGNGLLTPPLSSVSLDQQIINRQHGNRHELCFKMTKYWVSRLFCLTADRFSQTSWKIRLRISMYICTGLYISGFKFSYDSLEGFLRFKKKSCSTFGT